MTKPPYQINSSLRKNYPAHHPQESGGGMVDDVVPISLGGTGATTASQARTNLGLGSAATEDASAFLRPTITTTVTFDLPLSSSNQLMNLQQGYGIYSDNTGAGSHNSRLWLAGPDGGEVIVGPRAGAAFLHQIRLRANTTRIEGNCVVTGSSLTIDGSVSYHRGNILGTVSQSGGTPTGAIIERGSNANGEYVRYADGTQICWRPISVNTSNYVTFTLPSAFSNANYFAVANQNFENANLLSIKVGNRTTTTANVAIVAQSGYTTSSTMSLLAIGRWF